LLSGYRHEEEVIFLQPCQRKRIRPVSLMVLFCVLFSLGVVKKEPVLPSLSANKISDGTKSFLCVVQQSKRKSHVHLNNKKTQVQGLQARRLPRNLRTLPAGGILRTLYCWHQWYENPKKEQ
jgi:hypothetical protein